MWHWVVLQAQLHVAFLSGIIVLNCSCYRWKPRSGWLFLDGKTSFSAGTLSKAFGALKSTCMTGEELPPFSLCQPRALAASCLCFTCRRGPKPGVWSGIRTQVGLWWSGSSKDYVGEPGFLCFNKEWKKYAFFSFLCYERIQICIRSISSAINMPVTFFSFFKFVNWHPFISGIAVVKCYFSGKYWGMCVSLFWQWIDRWFIFPTWPKV